MHVKHLTQSLAHTKILVVVDDDFLKKMPRTVPSNYQIPQTHMTDLLLFTRGSLILFYFSMFYVHGHFSKALETLPVRISLGGTLNTYNGSYALHEPLSHML